MSFPFLPKLRPSGCGDPGAAIPFGCLFAGGQFLSRTAVAPASGTRLWLYAEVRRHKLGAQEHIFAAASGNNVFTIGFDTSDRFGINMGVAGSSTTGYAYTDRVFRDPAASYSVLVDIDTSRATASERLRLWINGERQAWSAGASFLGQNTILWAHPAGYQQRLGGGTSTYYGPTYSNLTLSRFACGDGAADIDVGAFGYTNRFGVWVPKAMPSAANLPLGNNGCVLDFAAPLDLGQDVSSKGNHWTASGLTVANQVTDTPTHGHFLFDRLGSPSIAMSQGNRRVTTGSGAGYYSAALGRLLRSTEKVAIKIKLAARGGANGAYIGIAKASRALGSSLAATAGACVYGDTGTVWRETASAAGNAAWGPGDAIVMLWDGPAGTLTWGRIVGDAGDPVWQPVGVSGLTGDYLPVIDAGGAATVATYEVVPTWTVPGFAALTTPAMACPPIKHPGRYFATRLRSAAAGVADLPWSPLTVKTLVLSKRRDSATDWRVNDTLRPGRAWATNTAAADFAEADGLTLTPTGYTIGAAAAYAGSRADYIWRASAAAGFDMILVDHVAGTPTTVPHAAGGIVDYAWVVPLAGGNRRVYHRALASGKYLTLDGTGAAATDAGWFASSAVDLTLGASLPTGRYALYLWRAVPGFSAFGSYASNYSADGPFLPMDFRPALVMAKYDTTGTTNGVLIDAARSPSNPVAAFLNPNAASVEGAATLADFVANGVKVRMVGTDLSTLNFTTAGTFVYAAWAETPLKFARAR